MNCVAHGSVSVLVGMGSTQLPGEELIRALSADRRPLLLAFAIGVQHLPLEKGECAASGTLESHAGVANVMVGPAPNHPHDHCTGQQERNSRQAKRLDV